MEGVGDLYQEGWDMERGGGGYEDNGWEGDPGSL